MNGATALFAAIWWGSSGLAVMTVRRFSGRVTRRLAAIERTPTSLHVDVRAFLDEPLLPDELLRAVHLGVLAPAT